MRPKEEWVATHCVEYRNRWHQNVPIYDSLPEGWRVIHGTTTQPTGCVWIQNGPFFIREGGRVRKNPSYKSVFMWDENYC